MEKLANENQVLIDYNDEEDAQVNAAPLQDEKSVTTKYLKWNRYDFYRGHYAGVGGSGFQSFFLKDEIMKAISECGFEHPSEGKIECIVMISSPKSMYS